MKKYKNLYKKAKEIYFGDNTGHDFSHIRRTIRLMKKIQRQEGGNEFVLMVATLFHDVHRIISNQQKQYITPEKSIPYVKELLKNFDIKEEQLEKILYLIKQHDNKEISTNIPLELKILQDADLIDSLGRVGLKRSLVYCKANNIPMFNREYPLSSSEYIPNTNPISTTHHIYQCLIPHFELIKTDTGKKLAKRHLRVLMKFLNKYIKKYNLPVA